MKNNLKLLFVITSEKGTKIWHIAVAAIVSMMLLLLSGWYGDETVTEPVSLVITALFICVYAVTFVLTKITGKKKRLAFAQFAVFVAVDIYGIWHYKSCRIY